MTSYQHTLKKMSDLAMKMSRAGFTDSLLEKFIDREPDGSYTPISEGLLRKIYLAYIELGEFKLKPGIVNLGESRDTNISEAWHGHIVQPDDLRFYKSTFDLKKLGLIPFLKKKETLLKDELLSIQESRPEVELGAVWHLQWLTMHQEFIPERWKFILRKKKGFIIFPRVRLGGDRVETRDRVTYPYLCADTNGYSINYSFQFAPEWELQRGSSYFAYVGKKERVPTLITNKDGTAKLVLKTQT